MSEFLETAYIEFVAYCATLPNTASGTGQWSADSNRGDDLARHMVADSGYTGSVSSQRYGFTILHAYLNGKGDTYTLANGTEEDVVACVREAQERLNRSPIVLVQRKPAR